MATGSEDGWGEVTPVRTGTPRAASTARPARAGVGFPPEVRRRPAGPSGDSGPALGVRERGSREPAAPRSADDPWLSGDGAERPLRPRLPAEQQRGLTAWAALIVLLAICAVGVIIDEISNSTSRTGFNIAIIVASFVAIVLVRRSAMFPVVVSPPLVYCLVSGVLLYIHSNGLQDHAALFDAGVNWLVYGFPAIAAATAVVLIVGGFRLVTRR